MKTVLPFFAMALVVCGFAAEAPDTSDATLRGYQAMQKMNRAPHLVPFDVSLLCGLARGGQSGARTGPHSSLLVNVFMNDTAQKHFATHSAYSYPAGSIVVKEKLGPEHASVPESLHSVAGLIKHERGYNAKTNDWEFFYFEKDGAMHRGAEAGLSSCADCHRGAPTDYVFGDFAKPVKTPTQPAS